MIFISVYKFYLSLLFSYQKQNKFPFTLTDPIAYFIICILYVKREPCGSRWVKHMNLAIFAIWESILNSSLVMGVIQKDKCNRSFPAVTLPQCTGNPTSSWPSTLISGQKHSWWCPHKVLEVKSAQCRMCDKTALLGPLLNEDLWE